MTKLKKAAPARVWNSGHPPFPGWWNASAIHDTNMWRWWDGRNWSWGVGSDASPAELESHIALKVKDRVSWRIEWTDYWPEGARVPRLNPLDGWLVNTGDMPRRLGISAKIEFVLRNGMQFPATAGTLRWELLDLPGDIFAWRRAR